MNKLILPNIILGATLSITISSVFAEGKHKGGHGHGSSHTSSHGEAHWASPKDASARINPIKSDQASLDRGKQLYMSNCTSCHGATAKGDGPLAKNLTPKPTNLTIMAGNHTDGDFEWKIANGRGAMPAWKSSLSTNQRWDLVNYIQALENSNGKGNMAGMDHSNMSEEDMRVMMLMMNGSSTDSTKDDDSGDGKQKAINTNGHNKNNEHKKHSHSH